MIRKDPDFWLELVAYLLIVAVSKSQMKNHKPPEKFSIDYHHRAILGVLMLGGLIGVTDFLWLKGFPVRSQLAFGVGVVLLLLVPFLHFTKLVRATMIMGILAASCVFLGNFFLYGSAYYLAAGFAVPLAAAMFLKASDAIIALLAYCSVGVIVGTCIDLGYWTPPFGLDYKFQLVINGLLIIAAMSITTIWREKILASLKNDERRQNKLLDTIFQNGYGLMLEADENEIITKATGQLVADLGYQEKDLIGRHQLEFVCPKDRRLLFERTQKVDGEFKYDQEVRIVGADSKYRWVRLSGGTVAIGPKKCWIVGVQDIEEAVVHRNRILEVSRLESLGELCGGLAHDFNNLLTVIGINAEFITDPHIRGEIQKAQNQAADLTASLLTFARKQEFRDQRIDLVSFLTELKPFIEKLAGPNVECECQMECSRAIVKIDPSQLQQVIINLVTNALHSMPSGGRLVVSCAKTNVPPDFVLDQAVASTLSYTVLKVCDDGLGMSEETKSRAVEPFFTTKARGKGTGLGLATVHGAIRGAGGSLNIRSQLGVGTEISIYLPEAFNQQSNSDAEPKSPYPKSFKGGFAILVIEDRIEVRRTLQMLLETAGYLVHIAEDAETATKMLKLISVDLVISDVVLPGESGVDFMKRLLQRDPDCRGILISGHQSQDLKFVEDYPNSIQYLPKPFSSKELLSLTKQMIRDHRLQNNAT